MIAYDSVYSDMAKKTTVKPKNLKDVESIEYIERVINLCKDAGLGSFKSPSLELHFRDEVPTRQNNIVVGHEELQEKANDELADLLLEDPVAYEEAMTRNG